MCKNTCVQSFVHFLAVIVFITYLVPILTPSVGVSLAQNALFSIEIPSLSAGSYADIEVISLIGIYQIDTGVDTTAKQWADLEDLHCTDSWISCTDLHFLRLFLFSATGLSLLSIILSCCHCFKMFGFSSFLLIICVGGTIAASTKITSDVAHKIHNENDALSFVCETSGLGSGLACLTDYWMDIFARSEGRAVHVPSGGWKFTLSESGVSIYISSLLVGVCASSAFVLISAAFLFVWFFFQALCCCCCCRKENEYEEYLNHVEGHSSINRV